MRVIFIFQLEVGIYILDSYNGGRLENVVLLLQTLKYSAFVIEHFSSTDFCWVNPTAS